MDQPTAAQTPRARTWMAHTRAYATMDTRAMDLNAKVRDRIRKHGLLAQNTRAPVDNLMDQPALKNAIQECFSAFGVCITSVGDRSKTACHLCIFSLCAGIVIVARTWHRFMPLDNSGHLERRNIDLGIRIGHGLHETSPRQ